MWSDQSRFRETALRVQRDLLRRLDAAKSRNEIISIINDAPPLRDRTEGPIVGMDWSILTANVPIGRVPGSTLMGIFGSNDPFGIRARNSTAIPSNRARDYYVSYHGYCRHKAVDFTRLTEQGVREWSDWARANGIRYSGLTGYYRPGKKTIAKVAKADFKAAKEHGLVPVGRRSPEAALRRAAKRRELRRSPVWKAQRAMPLFIEKPLVVVPSTSGSSLRRTWFSLHRDQRWTEFRAKQVIRPVTVCAVSKGRPSPLPDLVIKAITKIYSTEIVYRTLVPMPVLKPRLRPKFTLVVDPPTRRFVPPDMTDDRRRYMTQVIDGVLYKRWIGGFCEPVVLTDNG